MSHHLKLGLFFLIFALTEIFFSGCVSIENPLSPAPPKKADGIAFQIPQNGFQEISNPTVDHAWQNTKNGNTIAFLSECNPKTDETLKALEAENVAALSSTEITEDKDTSFNDREALFSTVNGQVDGIEVRMRLIIFKKNGCNYTLSYVGRKKHFEADENVFNTFAKDFKAP